MLKLRCGSWLALVYFKYVFFSPCADRALGYISGQACTVIITVRSGSAVIGLIMTNTHCTHKWMRLHMVRLVYYQNAGCELGIVWKFFESSSQTLHFGWHRIRNVAIIKYCLELATDTFLNRYMGEFWLIPKSRGSIPHPYTCQMSPT